MTAKYPNSSEVSWAAPKPGDWPYDPKEDPSWMDPSIPRRCIETDAQYKIVADHIVKQKRLAAGRDEIVNDEGEVVGVIIDNLGILVKAVQAHPYARLIRTTKADEQSPTLFTLEHCIITRCDLSNSEIGLSLSIDSHFACGVSFDSTSFKGLVLFNSASFEGGALFNSASFESIALFDSVRFKDEVSFESASFESIAWFNSASFEGEASFNSASFTRIVSFNSASFKDEASFKSASFESMAMFESASFESDASFDEATFTTLSVVDNLRFADIRKTRISRLSSPNTLKQVTARLFSRVYRSIGWTFLRSIGELSILTRVSVLALLVVPPLASAWPAIRAGIVGYNEAVTEASIIFQDSAASLQEAQANLPQETSEAVDKVVSDVEQSVTAWSDRFGGMAIDSQDLPPSLAWTFFAAAAVSFAQLIYQIRAPSLIKKHDEDSFVEWMHLRYPEDAMDRNDGLRRACDSLGAITNIRPNRHPNMITHHRETVWVPPKNNIELFQDINPLRAKTQTEMPAEQHKANQY